MKWSDFFKKLGLNIDDEMGESSTTDLENNSNGNLKTEKDNSVKTDEKTSNSKEDKVMAFVKPKVDKNGFIDLTNIEDADMKAFFKELNDSRKTELAARKAEDDKRTVDNAISKYAAGVKFSDGWTLDDALKLGDFSKVLNDENMQKEIENAFTNLKAAKAGMFVADKKVETKKSTPVLEGFNPASVERSTTMTEDEIIAMAYGVEE